MGEVLCLESWVSSDEDNDRSLWRALLVVTKMWPLDPMPTSRSYEGHCRLVVRRSLAY